ncbi:hypothetical protein EJ06DRAFT_522180 [Trichodelitschia bisporula]|uniref:Uncharacterized protein n=1 Tax=Trichodelitschia bisporula TaxID=703511 RepID=A0A6G1HW65_9PEZI|nr:hypothetical protein EJ06DRAFT_522180 [Trichodelitschia bisporula]
MDPSLIAQRAKHTAPKAAEPAYADKTSFQRKLYANAFANTLASQVRNCPVTNTRLPRALLLRFTVQHAPHPPHAPALIPDTLFHEASFGASILHEESPRWRNPPTPLTPGASASYLNLSAPLIASLATKGHYERALTKRQKGKLGPMAAENVVWRPDMPDLVLALLRQSAAGHVRRVLRSEAAHPLGDASEAGAVDGVVAVVYAGYVEGAAVRTAMEQIRAAETHTRELAREVKAWQVGRARRAARLERETQMLKSGEWARGGERGDRVQVKVKKEKETPVVPALPRWRTVEWRGARVPVYDLGEMFVVSESE